MENIHINLICSITDYTHPPLPQISSFIDIQAETRYLLYCILGYFCVNIFVQLHFRGWRSPQNFFNSKTSPDYFLLKT